MYVWGNERMGKKMKWDESLIDREKEFLIDFGI
jgi:hypothetical protein